MATGDAPPPFTLEFWADEDGREPVRDWLKELPKATRKLAGSLMNEVLQWHGTNVCETRRGRHVAPGVFEFRIDDTLELRVGNTRRVSRVVLRIFCHAYGEQIVLLLAAYDKSAAPGKKRQQAVIATAKQRLSSWQERRKRTSQ